MVWPYQLQASSFNSSKYINIDSQNVISEPKIDALLNGAEIVSKLIHEMYNFSTLMSNSWNPTWKIEILAWGTAQSDKTSSPFERAPNFDLAMAICESRLKSLL
jgi:hypothetical protein